MRPGWLAYALLALLLVPGAAACSVTGGTVMVARFSRWDPASGEVMHWPPMRTGYGGSCEPSLPGAVFDGQRLLWAQDGRLRVGEADGAVRSTIAVSGELLGQNGSRLLALATRDAGRSPAAVDIATGSAQPLAWPIEQRRPFRADGSRIAWVEGGRSDQERPGPARLIVHDLLAGPVAERGVQVDEADVSEARIAALGPRWVVGYAEKTFDAYTLWVYDLAQQRFHTHPEWPMAPAVQRGPLGSAAFLDGDTLYVLVASPVGPAMLWRAALPDGPPGRVADVPNLGPNLAAVAVADGLVVFGSGQLRPGALGGLIPMDVPGAAPALVLLALAAGAMAGRRGR